MQVNLSPHAEDLLRQVLARDPGRSPEEILEQLLDEQARRAGDQTAEPTDPLWQCLKSIPGIPSAATDLCSKLTDTMKRYGYPPIGLHNSQILNLSQSKASRFPSSLSGSVAELFYLDSRAWVKRYVQELGSPWPQILDLNFLVGDSTPKPQEDR